MEIPLEGLRQSKAVLGIQKKESVLDNFSYMEEALLLAADYRQKPQELLIIENSAYMAQKPYERLQALLGDEVLLFSLEEPLRIEAIVTSPENEAIQVEAMAKLQQQDAFVTVLSTAAAIRFLPSLEVFKNHCITLKQNQEIEYEDLKQFLFEAGYTHVNRADQPLCYTAHGGIIDVCSMSCDYPLRIEFFDNIAESIRFFDITTQRTIEIVQEAVIIPASDLLFTDAQVAELAEQANKALKNQSPQHDIAMQKLLREHANGDLDLINNHMMGSRFYKYYTFLKNRSTVFDYAPDAQIILSSAEEVQGSVKHMHEEMVSYLQELFQKGISLRSFDVFTDLYSSIKKHSYMEFHQFVDYKEPITSQITTMSLGDINLERTMQEVWHQARERRVLLYLNHKKQGQVRGLLEEANTPWRNVTPTDTLEPEIQFLNANLPEGFTCLEEQIRVYTGKELFHSVKKAVRYNNKFKEAEVLRDCQELNVGDYVIHNQHDISKYLGIVNKKINGVHRDFLHITYKGNDVLLVPLKQSKLIRKFVSKEGASPKLSELDNGEWEKTKKEVSAKITELADRLVKLYASGDENVGHVFAKDTPLQKQFEEDFKYELTPDQARAIQEIKQDMESAKPMDRLLRGDVDFGKTEVATRATFRAVADGRQVALLCPTATLSLQHYETLMKRSRNFSVNIAVVNRFIKPSSQRHAIRDLKEGSVDILMGTHRLFSKDIVFRDLRLLVTDEEQRSSVEHKEKTKKLKNGVDVLSLSVTPIPRTLQVSLIGIRSLSQLEIPPMNRMPVQTYVTEGNFQMVKEIIQHELARNGRVFYLYNNVGEIYNVAKEFWDAMPKVKIGIAHGRMTREDAGDVMLQFTDNKYQVLICTTIIGTGVDIPNVNTILIEDIDHFGLSQLYQIRGRVGRSDRLAYAYLIHSPRKQLNEVAVRRSKSIKKSTQLDSGYKIAMRDLAIRNAGDMLGSQQTGSIGTIGINMYTEMLNSAIMEKKGAKPEVRPEMAKTSVRADVYIPSSFATEDYKKITLYQRMKDIHTRKELLAMMDEIKDNHGRLSKVVQLLFEKKRLDICINEPHVDAFHELPGAVELAFTSAQSNSIDGVALFEIMTTVSKNITVRYTNGKITVKLPGLKDWLYTMIEVLERTEPMEEEQTAS